jgi:hypothetical protein
MVDDAGQHVNCSHHRPDAGDPPCEAWATWLGETDAPLAEVKALLRTFDDGGDWTIEPQAASRPARPPQEPKKKAQGELF